MNKPFAPACERNQDVILETIKPWLQQSHSVLEIGSGTGQHAIFFAKAMPWLSWQTSDLKENHDGIQAWIDDTALTNALNPIELDALGNWPSLRPVDAIFTANTLHIMSKEAVAQLFQKLTPLVQQDTQLLIYGPFNINGQFTSPSNANFELWLKDRDPQSGIRDLEWIIDLAAQANLSFCDTVDMPANNKLLRFTQSN